MGHGATKANTKKVQGARKGTVKKANLKMNG